MQSAGTSAVIFDVLLLIIFTASNVSMHFCVFLVKNRKLWFPLFLTRDYVLHWEIAISQMFHVPRMAWMLGKCKIMHVSYISRIPLYLFIIFFAENLF